MSGLFDPEPFEQYPGQLSMEQLDHPAYWRVTVKRGGDIGQDIIWERSAAEAAACSERHSIGDDPTEALVVELLPFSDACVECGAPMEAHWLGACVEVPS